MIRSLGLLQASATVVSTGWKWAAVLIAAGAVLVFFAVVAVASRNTAAPPRAGTAASSAQAAAVNAAVAQGSPAPAPGKKGYGFREIIQGQDGASSTSKLQWLMWLVAVLFSYIALYVLRAAQGHYEAIANVPAHILTVLGLSTATMVAAKGITVGYANADMVSKGPNANGVILGGIFADDDGRPELSKIQMMAFTFVAIGIFLTNVFHEIALGDVGQLTIPNIDATLMALMGLSQLGYVGKKVASPVLNKAN